MVNTFLRCLCTPFPIDVYSKTDKTCHFQVASPYDALIFLFHIHTCLLQINESSKIVEPCKYCFINMGNGDVKQDDVGTGQFNSDKK